MKKLFGTDGIRGEVGKYPLKPEVVFTIGRALGIWLKEQEPQKKDLKLLIGKDTRHSGDELERALSKGAGQEGLEVLTVGVCPTPTVAYLTSCLQADLGLAVSASHNPGSDNGIKFFNSEGYKLFPFSEERIEEIFFSLSPGEIKLDLQLKDTQKQSRPEIDAPSLYLDFVQSSLNGLSLAGLKVVVDCAFGSFSKIAPRMFQKLKAEVFAINNEPDGNKINVDCGTLHPQAMSKKILQHNADLGIAFDGDGDRVIVADEQGNILDGDQLLAIFGRYFLEEDRLAGKTIVCTQMSNLGLELYLQRQGIRAIRTEVGDKYVLEEMLKRKLNLGGEQSGHIIMLERTTTGDGLIVALELIKILLKTKKRLSRLGQDFQKFPQILVNVKVKEKRPFAQIPGLNTAMKQNQEQLGRNGRILVRYSGTENLARIMVEGRKTAQVSQIANSLAEIIQQGQRK